MRSIKRILCCTDLSENAQAAVHAAVKVAELYEAPLTIVYVAHTDQAQFAPVLEPAAEEIKKRAKAEIAKVCPPGKAEVKVETVVKQGPAVETIVDLIRTGKFDLCVVGTHGRSGNLKGGVGSIAEKIVRKASCNVLLVRPEYADDFSRIHVATDFSDFSQVALERGADLAGKFEQKKLSLLHIYHLPEEYWLTGASAEKALAKMRGYAEQHAKEFLAKANTRSVKVEVALEEGADGGSLAAAVKKRKADLLVMGSHGRTVGGATLLGSVAEKTMRACPASMWIETDATHRIGVLRALGKIMGLSDG